MTTYTVDVNGNTSPTSPAFPQPVINDQLMPDGSYDTTANNPQVFIDGSFTLQSLFVGPSIEVVLGGGLFATGTDSLTGTGTITGSTDQTNIQPDFANFGRLDINGAIDIALNNSSQIVVSAGERLDLEGDLNRFIGGGASTITVAAGAELDLNSETVAATGALASQGTLKATAPTTTLSGTTTLGGTVLVQGDATNGVGSGTQVARLASTAGAYVATLDLRQASLSAAISNLTLGIDAAVHFGSTATTVQRFVVAGTATALQPLDSVIADGALTIAGDKSGAANQVAISQAEFGGGGTIDFTVAASDGGTSLQKQVTVDANTTLRNDASMTIGGQGSAASTIGSSTAASGSAFVNAAGAQLTLGAGAALSVAAIQNAGSIDVASGTVALEVAATGAGTIAVENGATLQLDAAVAQAVALRSGGTLRLTQPATFTGTLQAPAIGARIDLAGLGVTAATVSNGAIRLTTAAGSISLSETGLINGSTVALGSDGAGGTLLTIDASDLPHPVAYRFFDSVHGTQFLTTSLTETQSLQSSRPDLVYEGVGLAAANPAIDPAAAPVYRFFDTRFGTHFYTSSATERDTVLATRTDLVSEGVGFYEHAAQQAGDVAVYRFFDSHFGTHFYTASATERATVIATRPDLISEGVSFYAPSTT